MRTSIRRKLLYLSCSLAFSLVAAEVSLRLILFGGFEVGWALRHPKHFTDGSSDADYWKLLQRFRPYPPIPEHMYHSELGWLSAEIDSASLSNVDDERLQGRRPVLLYGDSYARCNTPAEDCFGRLLQDSDLTQTHALVNYGVRGYGLDQTWLLLERTVTHYEHLNPVVVIGIYVDDDLDRSAVELQRYPKPLFAVNDGALVPARSPVPSFERLLEEHPIRSRSYLWSYLLHGTTLLPARLHSWWTNEPESRARKIELNRAILDEIRNELESRGIEYFFLLFFGAEYLQSSGPSDWREEMLLDYFAEHRTPFVSSKPTLREDAEANGLSYADYYGTEGLVARHLLPLGNRVVFRAIRSGLNGSYSNHR